MDYLEFDLNYVITPGGERFERSDGLRICPLSAFLEEDLPSLL